VREYRAAGVLLVSAPRASLTQRYRVLLRGRDGADPFENRSIDVRVKAAFGRSWVETRSGILRQTSDHKRPFTASCSFSVGVGFRED